MNNYPPKLVVLVVYESKDNHWRGFCVPYDVSCNAKSKIDAINKLEKLVKLYEEGLGKYNYPQHLSIRKLTDQEDSLVFEKIKGRVAEHYAQHIRARIREDMFKFQKERFWQEVNNTITNSSVRIYSPTFTPSVPV